MEPWFKKLQCECGQRFVEETLQATIYIYGIILLEGKNDCFIGTTCPKCLKTILLNVDRANFEDAVSWLNGQDTFGMSHCFEPLGYFAPCSDLGLPEVVSEVEPKIDVLAGTEQVDPSKPSLIQTPVGSFYGGETDETDRLEQSFWSHESTENLDLDRYYRTYIEGLAGIYGSFYKVWWLTKNAVATALKHEQKRKVRCFPRYIHQFPLLEKVDQFSWKYYLERKIWSANQKIAQKAIDTLQDHGIEPESLDEPLVHPDLFGYFNHLKLEHLKDDSYLHASFQDILTDKSSFYSQFIKKTHTLDRFLDCREKKINIGSQPASRVEDELPDIKEFFEKGNGNEFLREKHVDFINRYVDSYQVAYFSPIDIWALKDDYLAYYLEYIKEKESKVSSQEVEVKTDEEKLVCNALEKLPKLHEQEGKRCVYLAWILKNKYAELNPKINPSEVAGTKELNNACNHVVLRTRKKWIAPLWKEDSLIGGKPPKNRPDFFLDSNDLKEYGQNRWLIKLFGCTILECAEIVKYLMKSR